MRTLFPCAALKTPPAFHEQRKQLERAKTGDLLKAKIQQRPGRDELVRQHILEDVGHVDPSLAERQRMLKKARLADQLNDQLSHRPGPLELIQKNILHTEEPIERAVKGKPIASLFLLLVDLYDGAFFISLIDRAHAISYPVLLIDPAAWRKEAQG